MVKLRKNNGIFTLFFFTISIFLFDSCRSKHYYNYEIKTDKILITSDYKNNAEIENYIAPYRNHIDTDLNKIISYCPQTMDKSEGKWQTTIGNLMADMTYSMGNPIFYSREKHNIDIIILNHGGIRSPLPKGDVTIRNAYNIMPFENNLVVLELTGKEIIEMVDYIVSEKKPHPIKGLRIILDSKTKKIKRVSINSEPLVLDKIYFVATTDYLTNGGDRMEFLTKFRKKYEMHYKIRSLMIDYFKQNDTLPVIRRENIILN